MARRSPHTVRQALRHVVGARDADDLPDSELLRRFVARHDADAFRALVRRHGPMVLGVCRALLRGEPDADDACQATFLVLARRAGSIRASDSLANWLHGVAYRTARKAQAEFARRRKHEPRVAKPEATFPDDRSWREVQEVLHEELASLSERYRAPLTLCYLQGKTLDEAAALLRLSKSTLKTRLERGRAILRARLVRRGLGPAAALLASAWPGAVSALPPELLESTLATATDGPASANVVALTKGVLNAMRITKLKFATAVLAVLAAVGLSLGGLAHTTPAQPPATGKEKEKVPAAVPVALAPIPRAAAPPAKEFDELTVAIRHSGLSNELSSSLKIEADGTCWYEVAGRPAIGDSPAWTPAKIKHKLPADQLRRLNTLLKETDWLAKAVSDEMQLHDSQYTLGLKRDGKTATLSCTGEHGPYKPLLTFLRGISSQEYLVYQLEWEPATMTEGRQKLNSFLGSPVGRPAFEIDYNRFVPWATRLVRNPFDRPTDDVVTAIRLVSFLKLESEREYLADLATDRNGQVREAVVGAMARLGGEKSVAVLKKMVRSTSDAPWELIKLGPLAVPAIAEAIRDGTEWENVQAERLIRAYIDHWSEVPKPIDEKVLDAVRANMADPKVKKLRTTYHEQLLKLAAQKEKERKE